MHTFQDAVASRRHTIADQFIEEEEEEENEVEKSANKRVIEGEENVNDDHGGRVSMILH